MVYTGHVHTGGNRKQTVWFRTRGFFAWINDEMELLLKVGHEHKALKMAEDRLGDISLILEQHWDHYPLPEEAMATGEE